MEMISGTKKNRTSPIPDFGTYLRRIYIAGSFHAGVEVSTRVATSYRGYGRVAC
jgi:hypothetical protein